MHQAFGLIQRQFGSFIAVHQIPCSSFVTQIISSRVIVRSIQRRYLCFSSPNQGIDSDVGPPAMCTLTVKELQELCRAAKLPVSGRKAELIARLQQAVPESAVAKTDVLPITTIRHDEAPELRHVVILACKS
jgi:hypothetical protein